MELPPYLCVWIILASQKSIWGLSPVTSSSCLSRSTLLNIVIFMLIGYVNAAAVKWKVPVISETALTKIVSNKCSAALRSKKLKLKTYEIWRRVCERTVWCIVYFKQIQKFCYVLDLSFCKIKFNITHSCLIVLALKYIYILRNSPGWAHIFIRSPPTFFGEVSTFLCILLCKMFPLCFSCQIAHVLTWYWQLKQSRSTFCIIKYKVM